MRLHSVAITRVPSALLVLICFVLWSTVAVAQQPAPARNRPPAPPRGGTIANGPPFDIDRLEKIVAERVIAPGRLMLAIRTRNVTFKATPENLQRLRNAGASEDILAVVREMSPAPAITPPSPPPPAPPKARTGVLTVNCAPGECSVTVDGVPSESRQGVWRRELPVGSKSISVKKTGYSAENRTVELSATGSTLSVSLKPDAATKQKHGEELLDKMLAALADDAIDIAADGSWTMQPKEGAPVEWNFAAKLGANQSTYGLSGQAGTYEMVCRAEKCEAKGKRAFGRGKPMPEEDARRADTHLRLFRRYYIAGLGRELRTGHMVGRLQPSAETNTLNPTTYELRLDGTDEGYDLSLDAQYLPVSVRYTQKLSGSPPIIMTYSEYVMAGKLRLPKRMSMKLPEERQGALQIRFDSLGPAK